MEKYDLKVIRKNSEISILDYGMQCLIFAPPSATPRTTKEFSEGKHGYVDMGTVLDGRRIPATFAITAQDTDDYYLLLNEIHRIFDSRETFYVRHFRQPWKRFKVKLETPIDPQKIGRFGRLSVNFYGESPFAESIGTSLDPRTFEVELWGVGQNIGVTEDNYIHTTNTFDINNIGDVPLDPRERYQEIKITYKGASTNLKIRNETTGEEWQYTGTTVATDEIVLEGVRSFKNGLSIFNDTNHRVITLDPGINNFTLTGTEGEFEIIFDTRFYYL